MTRAGTLVIVAARQVFILIPRLEMGAMIRAVQDNGILIQPLFLQLLNQTA